MSPPDDVDLALEAEPEIEADILDLDCLPAVLTAKEIAQVLRIPKSTVYDLAARGKLPVVKLGRTVRMSKATLIEFLSAGYTTRVKESSKEGGERGHVRGGTGG